MVLKSRQLHKNEPHNEICLYLNIFLLLHLTKKGMGVCGISYEDLPTGKSISVLVTQLGQALWNPMDCSLSVSSVHGILENIKSGLPFPSPGDLPNLGIKPGSPELQADSLPCKPPGEPKVFKTSLKN